MGCPIRRSRDQRSLASPPGFSQRAASFIASQCQGIHQMPLIRARSQETSAPQDDPRITLHGNPSPRKTAAHRGKPHLSRKRGNPARGRSHEDTSSDGASHTGSCPIGQKPVPAARPPRSHSQIRFTLQSTPAPKPRRTTRRTCGRGTCPPGRPGTKPGLLRTSAPEIRGQITEITTWSLTAGF